MNSSKNLDKYAERKVTDSPFYAVLRMRGHETNEWCIAVIGIGYDYAQAIDIAIEALDHKHGKWIQHVNEPSLWSCSICKTVIYSEHEEDRLKFHKWCGCCGADMRGDTDE